MTKQTRLFLIISAAVLLVGLGTGLIASFMGVQGLTIVGSDGPEELAYIPQDAGLVAFANVRDVMDSELRRKFLQMRPPVRDDSDFQTETGINVETDIDRVVAALAGGGEQDDRPLVLARGRFDEVRIEGLMRARGAEVETYKGTRLLTALENDHPFAVAFVEPGLAAFGTRAAVCRAIDTKSGAGGNITSNVEVMALIREIDEGDAWAAGRFDAMARGTRLPREFANQLPPIAWFAATGYINRGVEGLVRAEANTEAAAGDLREVIRGFMTLARLRTRQNANLSLLMSSLELGGEGRTVSIGFTIPAEMIDALAALRRPASPAPATPQPPAF